jgi:hypothetical protein
VELGFLHSRYLRGVPPPDFALIGQEHVNVMRALRPALLWPQPAGAGRSTQFPTAPGSGQGSGAGVRR